MLKVACLDFLWAFSCDE